MPNKVFYFKGILLAAFVGLVILGGCVGLNQSEGSPERKGPKDWQLTGRSKGYEEIELAILKDFVAFVKQSPILDNSDLEVYCQPGNVESLSKEFPGVRFLTQMAVGEARNNAVAVNIIAIRGDRHFADLGQKEADAIGFLIHERKMSTMTHRYTAQRNGTNWAAKKLGTGILR